MEIPVKPGYHLFIVLRKSKILKGPSLRHGSWLWAFSCIKVFLARNDLDSAEKFKDGSDVCDHDATIETGWKKIEVLQSQDSQLYIKLLICIMQKLKFEHNFAGAYLWCLIQLGLVWLFPQIFYLVGFGLFCLESLLSLWVLQVRDRTLHPLPLFFFSLPLYCFSAMV